MSDPTIECATIMGTPVIDGASATIEVYAIAAGLLPQDRHRFPIEGIDLLFGHTRVICRAVAFLGTQDDTGEPFTIRIPAATQLTAIARHLNHEAG